MKLFRIILIFVILMGLLTNEAKALSLSPFQNFLKATPTRSGFNPNQYSEDIKTQTGGSIKSKQAESKLNANNGSRPRKNYA